MSRYALVECALMTVLACGCAPGEQRLDTPPTEEAADGGFQFQPSAPGTEDDPTLTPTPPQDQGPTAEPAEQPDASSAQEQPDPPSDTENAPPTGGSAILSPVDVVEGDIITCTAVSAVDPDGDAVTWTFAWLVNGEAAPGQTGATLHSDWFNKGDHVVCVATPWDSHAAGLPVTSKT